MLRPLHNNVWGVTMFEQREHNFGIIEPYATKKLHRILVKEVGPKCQYVQPGDIVILPEQNGGAVVSVRTGAGEIERRYCVSEDMCLATWSQARTVVNPQLSLEGM